MDVPVVVRSSGDGSRIMATIQSDGTLVPFDADRVAMPIEGTISIVLTTKLPALETMSVPQRETLAVLTRCMAERYATAAGVKEDRMTELLRSSADVRSTITGAARDALGDAVVEDIAAQLIELLRDPQASEDAKRAALARVTDEELLEDVAMNGDDVMEYEWRIAAVQQIRSPSRLTNLFCTFEEEHWDAGCEAVVTRLRNRLMEWGESREPWTSALGTPSFPTHAEVLAHVHDPAIRFEILENADDLQLVESIDDSDCDVALRELAIARLVDPDAIVHAFTTATLQRLPPETRTQLIRRLTEQRHLWSVCNALYSTDTVAFVVAAARLLKRGRSDGGVRDLSPTIRSHVLVEVLRCTSESSSPEFRSAMLDRLDEGSLRDFIDRSGRIDLYQDALARMASPIQLELLLETLPPDDVLRTAVKDRIRALAR